MRLLSPLDTNGKTEKKQSQASLETKSGRLLWGAAVSLLFSAGLFITDVKSMTFLTRIKQFSLKSVSQIRSLGKKRVEEDKEGEEINEGNEKGVFCH